MMSNSLKIVRVEPEVLVVPRVWSGNPESRLSIPLGLGKITGWLGTWDAPELLAVSGS